MAGKLFGGGGGKSIFANSIEKAIKKGIERLTEAATLFPVVDGK